MSAITNQSELSLQRMLDERDQNTKLHENLMALSSRTRTRRRRSRRRSRSSVYREMAEQLDTPDRGDVEGRRGEPPRRRDGEGCPPGDGGLR
jgi:hypothetical protein